jgi:hypothetical protein
LAGAQHPPGLLIWLHALPWVDAMLFVPPARARGARSGSCCPGASLVAPCSKLLAGSTEHERIIHPEVLSRQRKEGLTKVTFNASVRFTDEGRGSPQRINDLSKKQNQNLHVLTCPFCESG